MESWFKACVPSASREMIIQLELEANSSTQHPSQLHSSVTRNEDVVLRIVLYGDTIHNYTFTVIQPGLEPELN